MSGSHFIDDMRKSRERTQYAVETAFISIKFIRAVINFIPSVVSLPVEVFLKRRIRFHIFTAIISLLTVGIVAKKAEESGVTTVGTSHLGLFLLALLLHTGLNLWRRWQSSSISSTKLDGLLWYFLVAKCRLRPNVAIFLVEPMLPVLFGLAMYWIAGDHIYGWFLCIAGAGLFLKRVEDARQLRNYLHQQAESQSISQMVGQEMQAKQAPTASATTCIAAPSISVNRPVSLTQAFAALNPALQQLVDVNQSAERGSPSVPAPAQSQ